MPSFDVVSQLNRQELTNAVDQASREIGQRYDFKDTQASLVLEKDKIIIAANSDGRVQAAWDVLQGKVVKRGVSLKALDPKPIEPAGGSMHKQTILLKEGVDQERAKKIVKEIKDSKMKVQASIQGNVVRVSGKKRDDLQEAIALLRTKDFDLPLQFTNFRD